MAENKEQQRLTMIDPYKLWKKLYFSNEQVWTAAFRDFINTDLFANGIDLILNTYLQYLRLHNDLIERFTEESPLASKRDVARVAELVVSLENKVDGMELDVEEKLESIGANVFNIRDNSVLDDLIVRIANLEVLITTVNNNLSALNQQPKPKKTTGRATAKNKPEPESENT